MEISSCVTNLTCILNLIFSNLIWISLVAILIFFRSLLVAPYVAWELLRNNRPSRGKGFGTLAADLFIAVWQSDKRCEENLNQCITEAGQTTQRSMTTQRVASEHLIPKKLAKIEGAKVQAIKNFRNRIIRWWVIRGLVLKYDDDVNIYRN